MVSNEKIIAFPHPKHFERLFGIVGVKKAWKAKNTPTHSRWAASSTENLADIGAKKVPVSTVRLLMHHIGVFDSEKDQLVG